jgi:hypothetical protein
MATILGFSGIDWGVETHAVLAPVRGCNPVTQRAAELDAIEGWTSRDLRLKR